MEYPTHFKYFCIITLLIVTFYLVLTKHDYDAFRSLRLPFTLTYVRPKNDPFDNATDETKNDLPSAASEFQSRVSDYYPRLPIHIFTQNLTLAGNRSKLILLGNGFFGDRTWSIATAGKTPSQKMIALKCPFLANHCDITADFNRFNEADAVVYHMRDGIDINRANVKRRPQQRFVFALWESPPHTPNLQRYRQFFNWTMTYRTQSDIITSYYSANAYVHTSSDFYRRMLQENSTRKLNLKTTTADFRPSDEALQKKKLGTAAALISNCGGSSKRLEFIRELKHHIDLKIYGRCGEACPPNTNCREFIGQNYYFILSFENSLCQDYTTEKFFASLEYPVVPVVLGATNYSSFIPSSGFIDTRQFSTMSLLAKYLNDTRNDKEKYLSYFAWKKDYVWGLGEFFTPFCDLCLRLHLDSKAHVIDNIHGWWFTNTCQSASLPT